MDGGARQAIVQRVAKSWLLLKQLTHIQEMKISLEEPQRILIAAF